MSGGGGFQDIPYEIRKSKKAKNVRIEVRPEGVIITVPPHVSDRQAAAFFRLKEEWVFKKIKEFNRIRESIPHTATFKNGDRILFQGEEFTIRVDEYEGKHVRIALNAQRLEVRVNGDLPEDERSQVIANKFRHFYRRMAREAVTERLEYFKGIIGVTYNTIRIGEQKTRWGSCSAKGTLSFNWKIVMAPPDVIDYVVVHELCHLKQMNHSKAFWRLVETFIPDFREHRKWLGKQGQFLGF